MPFNYSDNRYMSDIIFVAPSPVGEFVELARTPQGKLFRKHILTKGNLIHPVTKKNVKIDDDFVTKMAANFDAGVCPIVQIPLANDDNAHVESPDRNVGEVVGFETQGDKVFALMDARKMSEDFGKTLLGSSATFSQDYFDTKTGKRVGPTLLNVTVTNRPYLTDLDDYEEIVAASSDNKRENVVFLTAAPIEENEVMDLNTILETLLLEHGIDVADLQAKAAAGGPAVALSDALKDALGTIKLSNGETVSGDDIVGSVVELAETNVALSARVEKMEKKEAEDEVDGLIGQGRMLPAMRDTMIEIRLSNPEQFGKLVPENPFIKLSHEAGVSPDVEAVKQDEIDLEIARLSNKGAAMGLSMKADA